ncbi:hypothetical protein PHAVU_005G020500 [Phaseolus vulgaris]|uniref:Uncharacterized protein n=1 Tax=Phaseolus vulgaris TaxID=3885 RepID=V7BS74_PHAVU|nr:hypothetical protein PHAVU_005G020500g [Phaseolus vulgaris]ESW20857.1 hypothetical protein PHAVU_005G020500g [Phaseolus vulgaris]
MESLQFTQQFHQSQFHFMNRVSSKLKPKISFRAFWVSSTHSSSSSILTQTQNQSDPPITVPEKKRRVKASDTHFKENWLASLSYPFPEKTHLLNGEHDPTHQNDGSKWVLGIDPDVSGAVALLKTHGSVCSAQVFDSPHVKILVGKKNRTRRRLDAKSVVQLIRSFDAPIGTTAYLEQSLPFPQDGKQGWWSGGFGYGLWIGILVSSGFSVIPVPSFTWKAKFELSGSMTSKPLHPQSALIVTSNSWSDLTYRALYEPSLQVSPFMIIIVFTKPTHII